MDTVQKQWADELAATAPPSRRKHVRATVKRLWSKGLKEWLARANKIGRVVLERAATKSSYDLLFTMGLSGFKRNSIGGVWLLFCSSRAVPLNGRAVLALVGDVATGQVAVGPAVLDDNAEAVVPEGAVLATWESLVEHPELLHATADHLADRLNAMADRAMQAEGVPKANV